MLRKFIDVTNAILGVIRRQPRMVKVALVVALAAGVGLLIYHYFYHYFCYCPNGQPDCPECHQQ